MKALRNAVFVLGLLAMVASSEAQTPIVRETFAGSSTDIFSGGNFGTTNYWYIVPDGNGDPRVQTLGFRNDLAGANIAFFTPGTNAPVQATNTAAAGTKTLIVQSTNNLFVANDYVVIKYNSFTPPRYQCLQVTNVNADLKTLGLNSNLLYAVTGDATVWRMQNQAGAYRVGLATNTVTASSGQFVAGTRGQPMLLQMLSTTTAGLDLVSGVYGK